MALNITHCCYVVIITSILTWSSSLIKSSLADPKPEEARLKTEVFLSPKFTLQPGKVSNKIFENIDFPRGHIALKSFNGELVDEHGRSIPLHETYLHHWAVSRFYRRAGAGAPADDRILVKNSGVCENSLHHYFGIGAETRGTATRIPDPYGIEVGDGARVPEGYEEVWLLNVHAIDTRAAEDRMGCTECRCDLFNVTTDQSGRPLPGDYYGGLGCCYEGTSCKLEKGFDRSLLEKKRRSVYLRYTVKYVEWSEEIVPVKIYILDIADVLVKAGESRGIGVRHHCMVEYTVEPCHEGDDVEGCTDSRSVRARFPIDGDVIYGVGHQHAGATGMALYGQDGREICTSYPIYGEGRQAGNESGYIVGMTTCYPSPGSVKISYGETLNLVANYSRSVKHYGVMSLLYLLVAEPSAASNYPPLSSNPLRRISSRVYNATADMNGNWAVSVFGLAVLVGVCFFVFRRSGDHAPGDGYEPVV